MDKNVQFGEVEDKAGKAEGGRLHYIHVYHSLVFFATVLLTGEVSKAIIVILVCSA